MPKLIYPEGWINGINPFTQTEDLRGKTRKLLPRVKELISEGKLNQDNCIVRR